jgi:hypothetical protein
MWTTIGANPDERALDLELDLQLLEGTVLPPAHVVRVAEAAPTHGRHRAMGDDAQPLSEVRLEVIAIHASD